MGVQKGVGVGENLCFIPQSRKLCVTTGHTRTGVNPESAFKPCRVTVSRPSFCYTWAYFLLGTLVTFMHSFVVQAKAINIVQHLSIIKPTFHQQRPNTGKEGRKATVISSDIMRMIKSLVAFKLNDLNLDYVIARMTSYQKTYVNVRENSRF